MPKQRTCKRIFTNCSYCNNPLEVALHSHKKDHKHFFCNRECYHEYLRENGRNKPAWNKISKADLQNELLRLNDILDRVPTLEDLKEHGKYCEDPFRSTFGTWNHALISVGLVPSKIGTKIPKEEALRDLKRVADIVGKQPTCDDYKKYGKYTVSRFSYHFGGFVYALQELGYPPFIKPDWDVNSINEADGHWLAGLVDGEGCFVVSRYNRERGSHSFACSFTIGFREDDWKTLIEIKRILDLDEKLNFREQRYVKNGKPFCNLHVDDTVSLYYKIVPTFDKFKLRSKKAKDFELWKEAVKIKFDKLASGRVQKRYIPREEERLNTIYKKCREVKQYKKPSIPKHILNLQ